MPGLLTREQATDLERGGEREVFVSVGHHPAQLVAGVRQRQRAVGLRQGARGGLRRERTAVPRRRRLAAPGAVIEPDVAGVRDVGAQRRIEELVLGPEHAALEPDHQ